MAKKLDTVATDLDTSTKPKRKRRKAKDVLGDAVKGAVSRVATSDSVVPTVSSAAISGIQATQRALAQDQTGILPELDGYRPTDFENPSSTLTPATDSERETALDDIKQQANRADIIGANLSLISKVEGLKAQMASVVAAQAKTQTSVEAITTNLVDHQLQQEKSSAKRAELANAVLERQGIEGLAALIRQKQSARQAKALADIKKIEASAAKAMNAVDVEHVEIGGV